MLGFPPELLVTGLFTSAALLVHHLIKRRESMWQSTVAAWRRTAEKLDMEMSSDSRSGRIQLRGTIGVTEVLIETELDNALGVPITRFTVEMPDVLPHDLRIARLDLTRAAKHRVELGDNAVDDHLAISGSSPAIFALFDEITRLRVLREVDGRTQITRGAIVRELTGRVFEAQRLTSVVRMMTDLGYALQIEPRDIDKRLISNLRVERCIGVRRKIYTLILQPGATSRISDVVAKIGLNDEDPFIRMLSALHLGPEHFDLVERIAREESLPHEIRLFAFGHLAARGPLDWSRGFIGRVMRIDGRSAQRAVLRSLVAGKRTDVAQVVIDAVRETELSNETLYEVSEALGRLGDHASEPVLCEILLSPVVQLRLSAIHALAHVGTVRSVEPLHLIAKNFLTEPSEVREAAKVSIRAIQGRIANAGAGRLSVIDPEDQRGAISYVHSAGALSIEDESLPPVSISQSA